MDLLISSLILSFIVWLYFRNNPMHHSHRFMMRRFINWFPLGMTYAFLYMGRYNLNVSKNAFGDLMSKEDFGIIFGIGTAVYGFSFLINGPLVDKMGGKKGILVAALGSCLCNILMGLVTYTYLHQQMAINLTVTFSFLYALNMFFQSYGAVSIIKVKSYWFHVRERGVFGGIFGTLLSMGAYFAFDWGQAIVDATRKTLENPTGFQKFLRLLFAIDTETTDAIWLVFFIPSFILIFWSLIDMVLLKDTPSQANFDDFDTHDASSDEMHIEFTMMDLLKKVFRSPIMITLALIEFCNGVIRNGIMQWYFIFAKEIPQPGAEFFLKHWGLLLFVFGSIGGFAVGYISDHWFQSRRAPPAVLFNLVILVCLMIMSFVLKTSPILVGASAVLIQCAAIGVHSLMSGTASADFGGRKATATASGIIDGFVYLGSGIQSVCLGFLVTKDWQFWPIFLLPFIAAGTYLAVRVWAELPEATKRYLRTVEKKTVPSHK